MRLLVSNMFNFLIHTTAMNYYILITVMCSNSSYAIHHLCGWDEKLKESNLVRIIHRLKFISEFPNIVQDLLSSYYTTFL